MPIRRSDHGRTRGWHARGDDRLPITGGSLRCEHAKAPTSYGVALAHSAVEFYESNCVGCPHRKPTEATEHLGTWADEIIAERKEHERQAEEARLAAEEARRLRREDRRLRFGIPDPTGQSILDLIDRVNGEHQDHEAEELLVRHAELSPGDFSDELLEHLTSEAVSVGNVALLEAVVAVFERDGRPWTSRMLDVAFGAVTAGVAGAACGRASRPTPRSLTSKTEPSPQSWCSPLARWITRSRPTGEAPNPRRCYGCRVRRFIRDDCTRLTILRAHSSTHEHQPAIPICVTQYEGIPMLAMPLLNGRRDERIARVLDQAGQTPITEGAAHRLRQRVTGTGYARVEHRRPAIDHARAPRPAPFTVGTRRRRQRDSPISPIDEVRRTRVTPVDVSPPGGGRVVLIEEVVQVAPVHRAVWVVQPAFGRRDVKGRAAGRPVFDRFEIGHLASHSSVERQPSTCPVHHGNS